MRMRTPGGPVRLVLFFLALVLLPSLLLAWVTLRAVDTERRTRAARLLEGYERFGEFAARTIHHELAEEESVWSGLLPPAPGAPLPDSVAIGMTYARRIWVLGADGSVASNLDTPPVALSRAPFPDAAHGWAWETAVARIDSLEFEAGDAGAAARAYAAVASTLDAPRLQAIALAGLARTALVAGDPRAALTAARRLREEHPHLFDLDAEPLDLVARWSEARALEALADPQAAQAWEDLGRATLERSAELTAAQRAFYRDRAVAALERLAPQGPAVERRRALAAARAEPPGDASLVRKLERRLLLARLSGARPTQRMHYLSDVVDGVPFLIAYRLLRAPDGSIGGVAGLIVDLPRLSSAVLPRFLGELESARLAIVDDSGHAVIGAAPDTSATVITTSLGEPFEFWSVAMSGLSPQALTGIDVRTRAWLAAVAVLLLSIVAGAVLVVRGLRQQARLANLKTTFVSNVSHELRTPLASIRMYAEMLEMGGARLDSAERQRQLAVIRSECGRLERLIDAVLDFASMSRGARRFHFEYEEIGPLVAAAAESFRGQATTQGFEYRVEIEPDLPEVRVDADAIRQVVLNLLSNAVKYSDQERWIAVRAYRHNDAIAIEVEDHGIGIDPVDQKRIFDDFYRVDERLSTTRQGVGLGLTLVRQIVEGHHGRVEIRSARGNGARFTVWLPCEPQSAAPRTDGAVAQEAES